MRMQLHDWYFIKLFGLLHDGELSVLRLLGHDNGHLQFFAYLIIPFRLGRRDRRSPRADAAVQPGPAWAARAGDRAAQPLPQPHPGHGPDAG